MLRWLNWMPTVALTYLTVWVLVSIPIGMAVGHCVLEDEADRPDDIIPDDITSPSRQTRPRPAAPAAARDAAGQAFRRR